MTDDRPRRHSKKESDFPTRIKNRDETSLFAAATACSPCWLLFYVLMFYLDLPFALTYFLVFVIRGFMRHFAQTMRWALWTKHLIKLRITNSKKRADPDIIIIYHLYVCVWLPYFYSLDAENRKAKIQKVSKSQRPKVSNKLSCGMVSSRIIEK